jgi:predicted nucleotidyltransferase component of viral defense system
LIPQAFITEWRNAAPWTDDAQVEQDLVLSRAVVELFGIEQFSQKFVLRGGTALNKLYLPEPVRYSEDIDNVQVKSAPIGPMLDAIRAKLDPWLGEPKRSTKQMVSLVYRFESETPPIRPLRLKIEINTHEHFTVLGYEKKRIAVDSRWFSGAADINTYALDELMGTKLRALYQRRKGRDLFDLWLCLDRKMVHPTIVLKCFERYMDFEHHPVRRDQFEENMHKKSTDSAFLSDINPLLAEGISYDPVIALASVTKALIERLPGEPWSGPIASAMTQKRPKP